MNATKNFDIRCRCIWRSVNIKLKKIKHSINHKDYHVTVYLRWAELRKVQVRTSPLLVLHRPIVFGRAFVTIRYHNSSFPFLKRHMSLLRILPSSIIGRFSFSEKNSWSQVICQRNLCLTFLIILVAVLLCSLALDRWLFTVPILKYILIHRAFYRLQHDLCGELDPFKFTLFFFPLPFFIFSSRTGGHTLFRISCVRRVNAWSMFELESALVST